MRCARWLDRPSESVYFVIQSETTIMKPAHLLPRLSFKPVVAATELLLIFAAVLFMTALFARNLQPPQYQPAHTAEQIVAWYAARPHLGLWILLIALPGTVLVTGGVTLLRTWSAEPELRAVAQETFATIRKHLAILCVAAATLIAGAILAIVALHLITD